MKAFYGKIVKRIFDLLFSGLALLCLSPLLLILSLLVHAKLGSPAIFRQERPGKKGKIFTIYKFRTMTDAHDAEGNLLSDEVRLTAFGKMLRKTSLDELPELYNIFKGDMSFVGPRPLLVQYLSRYSKEQARRHEVKPGLTGWAQVNGRNAISWTQKFKYDVWYVDHISMALDIKIFFQTIVGVVKREGISADGAATMPEFMGDES
ncbi:MAG: sugar transferase [Clostridiales Family XIII bacterium]|jgi:lipopolysaccharide/colanic/teichoic acid biosynthesis glycosyltransferase|nr:sugar transferase [Clostridiales Family XIII bacterium]